MIGNFGSEIYFVVSSDKIQTFRNYSETIGSRWAEHNLIGRMPRSEFIGADLMTVSMTVELNAALGVNPWSVRDRLKNAVRNGTVDSLVLGGKQPAYNKFKIISAQDTFDQIFNDGKIARITMNLTFKEHVE